MFQLTPISKDDARQMNALQLAYLGDTVWSTIVRTRFVCRKMNVHHLHQVTVSMVNAAAQAKALAIIMDHLTEEEQDIARRGRNAHARHPAPKNQDPADYADSTAFETLLGFWYITGDPDRLDTVTNMILEEMDHA